MSQTFKNKYAKNIEYHRFSESLDQSKTLSSTVSDCIDELSQPEDPDNFFDDYRGYQDYQSADSFEELPFQKFDVSYQQQEQLDPIHLPELQLYPENEKHLPWYDDQKNNQEEEYVLLLQEKEYFPHEQEDLSQQSHIGILIKDDENETDMSSLFGPNENAVFEKQEDIKLETPIACLELEIPLKEEFQPLYSSGEIEQSQTEQRTPTRQTSFIDHNRSRRLKMKNCMQNNACEETKNFFNHIVPFIEKNIDARWISCLKSFKLQSNHKSLRFLNVLAQEISTLDSTDQQDFQKDFEKLIQKDVRIWAMNHIKLDTTFVILKYADALVTVMNNPKRFNSIKKAKEAHIAHFKQSFG